MKKTNARNRRKKSQQIFVPFLPAWVYLIDHASGAEQCARAPRYIVSQASLLKILATQKDRTL